MISLLYIFYAALFFTVGVLVFDIPGNGVIRLLLSPVFYFTVGAMIFSGLALWEGKRWAFSLLIPSNLLLLYFHAVITTEYSASNHKVFGFLIVLLFQGISIVRVYRELQVPYYAPKIRWWESNPRYRLNVPVKILALDNANFSGDILDLSLGGCFVKLRGDLELESAIVLEFEVFGHSLRCDGVVVWRTQSTVTHPRGVGIKFSLLNRQQKRILKLTMRRLRRIAIFYSRYRYLMNQDEFLKKFDELEKEMLQSPSHPLKRAG